MGAASRPASKQQIRSHNNSDIADTNLFDAFLVQKTIRRLDYRFSMFFPDRFISLLHEGRNEPFAASADELNPIANLLRSEKCKLRSERVDEEVVDGKNMSTIIHCAVHRFELHMGIAEKNEVSQFVNLSLLLTSASTNYPETL
jgi:hypothetical protein